jgi:hypothetical protein
LNVIFWKDITRTIHCGEAGFTGNRLLDDPEHADPGKPDVFLNAFIFRRLVDLSVRGEAFVAKIPEIIMMAQEAVRSDPRRIKADASH